MKAKEKVQALINICNKCNPENEALFAIYATMKKGDYFAVGDMDLVHRGIYEILKKGIAGEENDPKTVVAWSILAALRDLQDEGIDINELLTAFDDDEPDDCPNCELFDKCHEERAEAWRTILKTN
ncbi:MAG: hypothetical protein II453_09030 [Alphaproteobacteria bacterium]|nr:hypothetical protein [Alphaproteobacteria bacterium]